MKPMEFIHAEVKASVEEKTNDFLKKEVKVGLIERISDVRTEISKVKTELILWIVSVGVLQYLLLMLTKKFF